MSIYAALFTILAALLLIGIVWLVAVPLPRENSAEAAKLHIEDLVPRHSQHFPQLRQSLQRADHQYVRQRASKEAERRWLEDRRKVLRAFLEGLGEDFARLDQLATLIAAHSANVSRKEEFLRLWLSMRFRFNYRMVAMSISTGRIGSTRELVRLTELVGSLSARTETMMARLDVAANDSAS
jgi:hypothetical protein